MSAEGNEQRALDVAAESGLVRAGEPLLVLLSGGADSVCLLDVTVRLGAGVHALHVNYGLRAEADADERHCRELCRSLGVPLEVEWPAIAAATGPGNLQAEAREARYAEAERRSRELGGDYATAHTRSDQAETVIYRLAVSPGRRALLGLVPRRGRLVRPLLRATRAETTGYCRARGLRWRDDPYNRDPRFARSRVRHEVMPVLCELSPAAEATIAETSRLLREEAEVLDRAVDEALERLGGPAVPLSALRAEPPALARLVLRRLGEDAGGTVSATDVDAILGLGERDRGGTASLDLGGGLQAVVEYGTLRFTTEAAPPPSEPVRLPVPGAVPFGPWEVEARPGEGGDADLAAAALGRSVLVRAWRPGDRMRPAGLGGTKSLQDLFTDRKVPRALRGSLPVIEVEGEIAWVAGVAAGERFVAAPEAREADLVAVSARRRVR